MAKLRGTAGDGGGDDGGGMGGGGGTPGKRARTDQLPPDSATEIASAGVTGSSTRLPHADEIIAAAPEHRAIIEGIEAHVGGPARSALATLGAQAYTIGNHIAFAAPPDLHLVAHEVAHVLQQRAGVQIAGGVGTAGDSHEQEADAFADRVATKQPLPRLQLGKAGASTAVQLKPATPDLKIPVPEDISEATDNFRRGLGSHDVTVAEMGWTMMTPADRVKFGTGRTINGDLFTIARVLGGMTVPIMAECHLDFTGRDDLIEYMLQIGMPNWFDPVAIHGGMLLSTFLAHLPERGRIDAASIKKLDRIMTGTTSLALARPLFERIYTTLSDTTYKASVHTVPWKTEQIHRLYDILSTHLPLAHVRTITAFYLATGTDYAWWTNDSRVVLPVSDATGDGGSKSHHMVGGKRAQEDPKTNKDPKTGKEGKGEMGKFDVGALHEVGHGVGGRLGGHAWAETHPFVNWQTNLPVDKWSKGLWGDDLALTARARAKAGKRPVLAANDARHYLADAIHTTATLPAGFQTAQDVEDAIEEFYGDQKLTQYWRAQQAAADNTRSYLFSGTENYGTDGNVYVWLSRNGRDLSTYTQQAHQQKVSWYSLSSPHEWFAEQYAQYYAGGRTGAGLEPGTKAKLDELDKAKPDDNSLMPPGASSDSDSAGEGAAEGRRVPFPW